MKEITVGEPLSQARDFLSPPPTGERIITSISAHESTGDSEVK
jgi:hypothetical protein